MRLENKFKLAETILISVVEISCAPWLIKSFLYLRNPTKFSEWLRNGWKGIFKAWSFLFTEKMVLQGFLVLQLTLAFLLIRYIWWNPSSRKKSTKKVNGKGGPEAAGNGEYGTARWQTEEEKVKGVAIWMEGQPIDKGGLVLGMEIVDGKELFYYVSEDEHTLMIATTRKGKDRRVYLPSIYLIAKAGESMFATDVKGDMYITTKPFLEKMKYRVLCLNFKDPLKSEGWNLIEEVNNAVKRKDLSSAIEAAWDIAHRFIGANASEHTEPIWIEGAESTIASLILLTSIEAPLDEHKHMTTVYYILSELGEPTEDGFVPLIEYMKKLPVKHPARAAFATARLAHEKGRASFFMSVSAALRLFSDPKVSQMTSKSTFTYESISTEKTALFLILPHSKTTRNFLASLFIDQFYQASVEFAERRGGRLPKRIHLIGNELGNLPTIKDFDTKLTVGGGIGFRIHIAVQALQQLIKHYKENFHTIMDNCHTWLYFAGADTQMANKLSERIGSYTIETIGSSSNIQVHHGNQQSVGDSSGLTGRKLLMEDEILRWDPAVDGSLVLPISKFPASYPLPDLSVYKANEEFGLARPSGDIENDKEENRKILEGRWEKIQEKTPIDVPIWVPIVKMPEKKPVSQMQKKEKAPSSEEKESQEEINFL